jgi:hypothetical protein
MSDIEVRDAAGSALCGMTVISPGDREPCENAGDAADLTVVGSGPQGQPFEGVLEYTYDEQLATSRAHDGYASQRSGFGQAPLAFSSSAPGASSAKLSAGSSDDLAVEFLEGKRRSVEGRGVRVRAHDAAGRDR